MWGHKQLGSGLGLILFEEFTCRLVAPVGVYDGAEQIANVFYTYIEDRKLLVSFVIILVLIRKSKVKVTGSTFRLFTSFVC